MIAILDPNVLKFQGVPRTELEARVESLVATLRATTTNLTEVQARCTGLLMENRELRLAGTNDAIFCREVLAEVSRARGLYPTNEHRLAALMEEAGEVAKALLEGESDEALRAECVQLAGQALRLAVEGDGDFGRGGCGR